MWVTCKKCLLDIPARNIWFLQEGLRMSVGLASAVTRSLTSNAKILENVVSGRLEVNCWGAEAKQSNSRKKEEVHHTYMGGLYNFLIKYIITSPNFNIVSCKL